MSKITSIEGRILYNSRGSKTIEVDIESDDSCGGLRPGYRAQRTPNLKPDYVAPNRSDINGDNLINVSDLLAIVSAWGTCEGCLEDVNLDSSVNVSDLLMVIENWDT